MLAQIVLTPAESKKLIADAVLALPEVQYALKNGIVAMHPSTSTWFMFKALFGDTPLPLDVMVCGVIAQKGLVYSAESARMNASEPGSSNDPLDSKVVWMIKKGALQPRTALRDILDQMTETDVYIKGCNALDAQGNVGVLFGHPRGGGGTIGRAIIARRSRPFHMILPIGLEKLIPVSIDTAAKRAGFTRVEKSMGMPCGLIPVPGKKVDETDAFSLLCGVTATPIAAGGLGGAEGSVVLTLDGEPEQIEQAWNLVERIKGAQLGRVKGSSQFRDSWR